MGHCKRWLCLSIILASSCRLQAQDADSLLLLPTDSILSYSDSLSIFYLIDSLLALEENAPGSQLAVRLAYNSNVLSAGRTLGIDQFGLSPGLSYYHKSGLFADVSSYWSKDFEPNYYLTILSAGYMHTFTRHFSLIAGYDRYFYNTEVEDEFIPYKNALSITPYVDLNLISFRLDYSYYFGDKDVHRLMPSVSLNLAKKGLFKIDKVMLTPAFYALFGNEELVEIEIIYPSSLLERLQNYNRYGTPYKILVTESNVFGAMNYAFSLPLTVNHRNWSFFVSYTYTIPKALPGEPLLLSESGFLAAGLTYYIDLKKPFSD